MVEKEATIPSEVSEVFVVLVRRISHFLRFSMGHGLSGFAGDTDVIKMDGMVKHVLRCGNHHSVSRNFFIHGDVNAQKKADDQKTDHNDGSNFTLWRLSHSSVLQQGPCLNA